MKPDFSLYVVLLDNFYIMIVIPLSLPIAFNYIIALYIKFDNLKKKLFWTMFDIYQNKFFLLSYFHKLLHAVSR